MGSALRGIEGSASALGQERLSLLQILDSLCVGLSYGSTVGESELTEDVLGRALDDRYTEVLLGALIIGTSVGSHEVEVKEATYEVSFSDMRLDLGIGGGAIELDDVGGLYDSLVAIVPEGL